MTAHPIHIGVDASRLAVNQRTGTERYSYELIAAMARVDRRSYYTLYCNGLPPALPPLGPNFCLRSLPLRRAWTHARLGPELALRPPDVVFVPAHVIPLTRPRAAVVTIHDLGYLAFPEAHTARRRLELHLTTLWSVRAARQVIAISGATRDDLIRHYRADPARISVVHHGLSAGFSPLDDASQIVAARARYGIGASYFLYVGTVQPRKNLERLIEAFAQADIPGVELVIAGKRGWLTERIERRAGELGVTGRVRFIGYLPDEDLPALLSGALAFVFPSLYEGFGMPVLEAMACGAPVLTACTSALPEVAGDAAILIDPADVDAIAAGLTRLAGDAELRGELRLRGLARAASFSWERCARETIEVLRTACTS